MSGEERPLPKPPGKAFGRRRLDESEESVPLMADRMAAAMAEGKLEEFMKEEMPDNEYARTLALMMMGMTGMVPEASSPAVGGKTVDSAAEAGPSEASLAAQPPEDVIDAVHAGDVKGMMEILAREHEKRMADAEAGPVEGEAADTPGRLSDVEKETLNQLIKIASENKVSVDWIVLRALSLYIREYRNTGRL